MNHASPRVLIVEDDEDSARMLRVLLRRAGYETRVAGDGPSAIAAAREFEPRVVLLDQTLDGMTGVEVVQKLRGFSELEACVIVAVSGHDRHELPTPSPFDNHFRKPVDHDELLDYLSSIVRGASEVEG